MRCFSDSDGINGGKRCRIYLLYIRDMHTNISGDFSMDKMMGVPIFGQLRAKAATD